MVKASGGMRSVVKRRGLARATFSVGVLTLVLTGTITVGGATVPTSTPGPSQLACPLDVDAYPISSC